MLLTLTFDATFANTGRRLARTVDFEKGFGAIVGPNEAGKSFILEMIRFSLFGSPALRAALGTIKKLSADLTFSVRGKSYRITRTATSATLYEGKKEIAVGVRPVNVKVCQVLGFGLDVFDIACVCNQGDVEKLGAMKPTERKRMVDSVIGLSVIDELSKWAADEARGLHREAEAMEKLLHKPTEPVEPAGYRPAADLKADLDTSQAAQRELDQINGWLSHKRTPPVKPTCRIDLPSENIRSFMDKEIERKALQVQLDGLPQPSTYSDAELDKLELALKYPPSDWSPDQLEQIIEDWRYVKLYQKLERCPETVCPNCDHRWKNTEIEAEIGGVPCPRTPDISEDQARAELQRIIERGQYVPLPDAVLTQAEISQHRRANLVAIQRKELEAKLQGYPTTNQDWEAMYKERRAYEQALEAFRGELESYNTWIEEYRRKEARAMALEPQVDPTLSDQYAQAMAYEQRQLVYKQQLRQYDDLKDRITEAHASAAEWTKIREAMVTLRGLVKQHLVPSLNKVASSLLAQMTGGQRRQIVVDEDFDVTVDGQPLDTLSGSGKAVANLSLRLGLGQVLTNNVLSLFMGDEIDASMDKDRADNTAQTLQNLKSRINQILLVSHKTPQADYYVDLHNVV